MAGTSKKKPRFLALALGLLSLSATVTSANDKIIDYGTAPLSIDPTAENSPFSPIGVPSQCSSGILKVRQLFSRFLGASVLTSSGPEVNQGRLKSASRDLQMLFGYVDPKSGRKNKSALGQECLPYASGFAATLFIDYLIRPSFAFGPLDLQVGDVPTLPLISIFLNNHHALVPVTFEMRKEMGGKWLERSSTDPKFFSILGAYDCNQAVIFYDPTIPPVDMAGVVIHEISHFIRDRFPINIPESDVNGSTIGLVRDNVLSAIENLVHLAGHHQPTDLLDLKGQVLLDESLAVFAASYFEARIWRKAVFDMSGGFSSPISVPNPGAANLFDPNGSIVGILDLSDEDDQNSSIKEVKHDTFFNYLWGDVAENPKLLNVGLTRVSQGYFGSIVPEVNQIATNIQSMFPFADPFAFVENSGFDLAKRGTSSQWSPLWAKTNISPWTFDPAELTRLDQEFWSMLLATPTVACRDFDSGIQNGQLSGYIGSLLETGIKPEGGEGSKGDDFLVRPSSFTKACIFGSRP